MKNTGHKNHAQHQKKKQRENHTQHRSALSQEAVRHHIALHFICGQREEKEKSRNKT